jgi:hypothetical protein
MILLALLGCPTPTPPTVPAEGLEPVITVDGDRVQTVVEGSSATYLLDVTWPTADGSAPVEQADIDIPFTDGDVAEDGCHRRGEWVEDLQRWRFTVTPEVPGLHCLTRLNVRLGTPISSIEMQGPQLETRSVAEDVETVELPLDTVRMVVGEERPWVAGVWSPERPSGSLLINTSPYPSVGERSWSTADSAVATVDADGRITAHAAGSTTLTVEAGGVSATAELIVNDAPLGPPGPGLVEVGRVTPDGLDRSRWLGDADGAPVHVVRFGGLRHVMEWTGSGYGLFPIDTPGLPILHATAFLHDGRTWVAGFETHGHRHVLEGYRMVVLDRPTGSSEPWRRRELPTGYDEGGEPVPMRDFAASGLRDNAPQGTNKLIAVDAFFAVDGGQLYLASAQHTGQGYAVVPEGEGHCPSTVRLATIGDDAITSVTVDQRWYLRGRDAPPPDCDPVGIDRDHFPEVAVLPAGAFGQLPRVEARGTEENVGFVFDGTSWLPQAPVPMPPWTPADLDDNVVVEVIDVFRDGRQCLGIPAHPWERHFAHDPLGEPLELRAFSPHRVTGSTATHYLAGIGPTNDGVVVAWSEQVPCEPLPDDPPERGQLVGQALVATQPEDSGRAVWLDGAPVAMGHGNRFGLDVIAPPTVERTTSWLGADGIRRLYDFTLLLPDGTAIPDVPVLADDDPAGDYWYTTDTGLFRLDATASTPTTVPSPVPVADLERLVALPDGVVLIDFATNGDLWTWLDDAGTVVQTVTVADRQRALSRDLVALSDGRLADPDRDGIDLSSDGATWTTIPLPGERGIGPVAVQLNGDRLYAIGPEFRPFHGQQVSVRSTDDDGLTWSDPTWVHPLGPKEQRLCSASVAPDGTAVAAVLEVEVLALDFITEALDYRFFDPDNELKRGCGVLKSTPLPP